MLTFWELAPSPNNLKVRMALRFKRIEFEAIPVDPSARADVMRVSGQELTPVIADKGIVLNDSEAILHYLDANYRDVPRLFPANRAGRQECDAWKATLDENVASKWSPIFFAAIGVRQPPTPAEQKAFEDALAWLEETLGARSSFKGPEMPVCDLRVAEWIVYALPGKGLIARVPLFQRLQELYAVPPERFPALRGFLGPWNERLA